VGTKKLKTTNGRVWEEGLAWTPNVLLGERQNGLTGGWVLARKSEARKGRGKPRKRGCASQKEEKKERGKEGERCLMTD